MTSNRSLAIHIKVCKGVLHICLQTYTHSASPVLSGKVDATVASQDANLLHADDSAPPDGPPNKRAAAIARSYAAAISGPGLLSA